MDGKRVTAASGDAAWIAEWPSRLTPLVDLICFPGAGAGASAFRPWARRLPGFAALLACQLPGREERIDDAPARSLADTADEVVAAYVARRAAPRPLVLFGHSMGAVIAFEAAHWLSAIGRTPSAIFMSASTPPMGAGCGNMDPPALKALLLDYDPENQAIVSDDELFATLAPVLRSDILLLRRHRVEGTPLVPAVAAHLLAGADDRVVPAAAVRRWAPHFAGPVQLATLPGSHHFPFRESRDAVLQRLTGVLRGIVRGRSGG